jgi:hypothetical protein
MGSKGIFSACSCPFYAFFKQNVKIAFYLKVAFLYIFIPNPITELRRVADLERTLKCVMVKETYTC